MCIQKYDIIKSYITQIPYDFDDVQVSGVVSLTDLDYADGIAIMGKLFGMN